MANVSSERRLSASTGPDGMDNGARAEGRIDVQVPAESAHGSDWAVQQRFASAWQRLAAYVVDVIITWSVLAMSLLAATHMRPPATWNPGMQLTAVTAILMGLLLLSVVIGSTATALALGLSAAADVIAPWGIAWGNLVVATAVLVVIAYRPTCERLTGRTPGKALVGIRVIGRDGRPPGLGQSILRSAGLLVSEPLCGASGIAALMASHDRTRAGDRLARTQVVRKVMADSIGPSPLGVQD